MMHTATTFQVMQKENHNILATLNNDTFVTVRALIIDMILATDMARHFDLIGRFKAKMINSTDVNLDVPEERTEILKILTKASDVGHAAKSQELHQRWTFMICDEFFLQGDLEKERGMPISMYCDRQKTDIPKSQAGFIKNIVLPIYESLNLCFDSIEIKESCISQLLSNMYMWESSITKKRVNTLIVDFEETHTLKERTDTISINGRAGRNSLDHNIITKF
jgi:3'5'-cyclic nucleotide phosphodiesterase